MVLTSQKSFWIFKIETTYKILRSGLGYFKVLRTDKGHLNGKKTSRKENRR
jgi:hypothetical protein